MKYAPFQGPLIVTGSSGLIGSEVVRHFDRLGTSVIGIDNNMRAAFFGPGGDTSKNLQYLKSKTQHFTHVDLDIRNRDSVMSLFVEHQPSAVVHCAAQPSLQRAPH